MVYVSEHYIYIYYYEKLIENIKFLPDKNSFIESKQRADYVSIQVRQPKWLINSNDILVDKASSRSQGVAKDVLLDLHLQD